MTVQENDQALISIYEIIAVCPGVPVDAEPSFDVSAAGSMRPTERKILRYLVKKSAPYVSAAEVAACSDLAGLAKLVTRHEPTGSIELPRRGDYATSAVVMKPILPSDFPTLYQASLDPLYSHRWRFRGQTPTYEQFASMIGRDSLAEYCFWSQQKNGLVAYCAAYNADQVGRHCAVAVQRLDWSKQQDTAVVESIAIFLNYLFRTFGLNKVYFEIPEFNLELIGEVDGLIVEEGRRKDHYWHADRYWDEYVFAVYAKDWASWSKPFFASEQQHSA